MYQDEPIDPNDPGAGGDPSENQGDLEAARQYYRSYIKEHGLETWGTWEDAFNAYRAQRQAGKSHDEALGGALTQLGWDDPAKWPKPAGTGTTGGGGGSGSGTGTSTAPVTLPSGPLVDPFNQPFTPPAGRYEIPPIPGFAPPAFQKPPAFEYEDFSYDPFVAPTYAEAENDPGYQFTLGQGTQALQNSAAAGGVLRTGGTLKDLITYGQKAATTQYGNVLARNLGVYGTNRANAADIYGTNRANAVDTYNTNYQTQYLDPYKFAYQGAMDAYLPQQLDWSTRAQAGQRSSELDYDRYWDKYQFDYDAFRNWQLDTWKKAQDATA